MTRVIGYSEVGRATITNNKILTIGPPLRCIRIYSRLFNIILSVYDEYHNSVTWYQMRVDY